MPTRWCGGICVQPKRNSAATCAHERVFLTLSRSPLAQLTCNSRNPFYSDAALSIVKSLLKKHPSSPPKSWCPNVINLDCLLCLHNLNKVVLCGSTPAATTWEMSVLLQLFVFPRLMSKSDIDIVPSASSMCRSSPTGRCPVVRELGDADGIVAPNSSRTRNI